MNNRGLLTKNQQGHMKNYENVWYHPKAISNILSLRNSKKKNRIIYDSDNGDRFIVINTIPGVHYMIFTANKYRLYYNDKSNNKGVYMLSTVEENLKNYTKRQYERANKSR